MSYTKLFAAPSLLVGLAISSPALASVTLVAYTISASFPTGPIAATTLEIFLPFDSAGSAPAAVQSYQSSTAYASFNPSIVFDDFQISGLTSTPVYEVRIGDTDLGTLGSNDFALTFLVGADGRPLGLPFTNALPSLGYRDVDGNARFSSAQVTARVVPPVPEPSTWATMLVGFVTIGAALRRRKSFVALRYA